MCRAFFDSYSKQATITCYTCVCVCVCVFSFCFNFCGFDAMCMVCLIGFADRPPLVAVCVMVLSCCVFDAMCMIFLIGFADRPPLVAICVEFCFFVCLMLCAWFF